MKLQVAIDRTDMEMAERLVQEVEPYADILEVGTSLIKDYGLEESVGRLRRRFPDQCLLADIKTCDEGAYEFRKAYEAGGDIPTVMGFSSLSTIRACAQIAEEFGKEYMIDLLEVSQERIQMLSEAFPEAIFCIHLPADRQGEGLEDLIQKNVKAFQGQKKIAVAGGVTLSAIGTLKDCGIEIGIVGSGITKAENIRETAAEFAGLIHK